MMIDKLGYCVIYSEFNVLTVDSLFYSETAHGFNGFIYLFSQTGLS